MAGCSIAELQYMINHVVLPPKLPDRPELEDFVEATEKTLLNELLSVLRRFVQKCTPEVKPAWITVQRMLSRCANAKILNDLSEKLLTEAISDMSPGGKLKHCFPCSSWLKSIRQFARPHTRTKCSSNLPPRRRGH